MVDDGGPRDALASSGCRAAGGTVTWNPDDLWTGPETTGIAGKPSPSRDPQRIDAILAELGNVWKRNPDMRLGQLIGSLGIEWPTEDDAAYRRLREGLPQ
jgi:hypothetical protein